VFTASYDKSVKLWDVASGNLVREFKAAPDPRPEPKVEEPKKDDKKEEPKKEEPKKEEPKKDLGPPGHRDQVFSIAVSKDGKLLASGSSDRSVKVWDVATGAVVRDFANPDFKPVLPGEPAPSHPGWVHAVRFTPDGAFVVSGGAVGTRKGYLAVWRAADGKRVYGAERDGGPVRSVAVTPDGTRLVLGCAAAKGKPEAEVVVVKLPGK
jgi:WD40 repeat protein